MNSMLKSIFAAGMMMLCASSAMAQNPVTIETSAGTKTIDPSWPAPPKGEHPRLYLRGKEVAGVKDRMESQTGQKILRTLDKAGIDRTPEEEAKEKDRGFRYYFRMRGLTSRVQHQALDYLAYGSRKEGRQAIESMLDTLQRTNFGRKNDLSRASGVMLSVGAMVYDWCYDLMSEDEKQAYIKEFVRIAGTMECGYPPKRNEPIAGHSSEWMIMRDMLSAGIAIYDEYPDMYNYVIELLENEYVAARNLFYSGGNYHQGTDYVNVRFSNDLIAQWIIYKMCGKDLYSRDQQQVAYDFIYRRRPDGQVLPAGDCNHSRTRNASYALPAMLAASYYNDPYLQYEYERNMSLEPHCLVMRLLWQDFDLEAKAPDTLPLTRYNGSPFGWMIARTGWDAWSAMVEMKINEQFVGNHQHLDGGSFQIYYRGPLAIDTGFYQGSNGGYNSDNNKNYTKRTVAHNSLLIYDPSEVFETYNYGGEGQTPTACNEGGQRMPGKGWDTCRSFDQLMSEDFTVGKILAHGFGGGKDPQKKPEYSHLKGDITKAYSSKVSDVRRSFVFLNLGDPKIPAALVVFDHIVSSDPSFKKTWLLHSIEEPAVSGSGFTVKRTLDGDKGMLKCDVLWPASAALVKIGGPGKEFWSGGKNWESKPRTEDKEKEYGQWRVEESPASAQKEDIFLNVIQIADNDCGTLYPVSKIEGEAVAGALLSDRAVVFSKSGERLSGTVSFTVPGDSKKLKILVTDLEEGEWTVKCGGKPVKGSFKASADEGAVYIPGAAGEYEIVKK